MEVFSFCIFALLVAFVGLVLLFLAWLLSFSPDIFRGGNDTELDKLKCQESVHNLSYAFGKPKVYYPWKEIGGLMKMIKIKSSEWLELDEDSSFEVHILRNDNLSEKTFLIHRQYQEEIYFVGLELLETIIRHINELKPNSILMNYESSQDIREIVVDDDIRWRICSHPSNASSFTRMADNYHGEYHPLQIARLLVGEDLNLLIRSHDRHILIGSALCFPDRWHLESKLGLPLAAIHYPVNTLNTARETLEHHVLPSQSPVVRTMERFFDSLYENVDSCDSCDSAVARLGWGFQCHPRMTNRYVDEYSTSREFLRDTIEWFVGEKLERIFRSQIRQSLTIAANKLRTCLGFVPLEFI